MEKTRKNQIMRSWFIKAQKPAEKSTKKHRKAQKIIEKYRKA